VLTNDLIRSRIVSGAAKPQFIDPENQQLLAAAATLIAVYADGVGQPRSVLADAATPGIAAAGSDLRLGKGLNKLLLDRSTFGHDETIDYAALRQQAFAESANLLRTGQAADDPVAFGADVRRNCSLGDEAAFDPYADHPDNEPLRHFRAVQPVELLQRYNCALVQSLLLRANALELEVIEPEAAKVRRVFKYLKFFRLLARIRQGTVRRVETPEGRRSIRALSVTVDGPASLFEQTQKYGLQLASFFPAVCDLLRWRLDTDVTVKRRKVRLRLDQKSGLVSHYRNFGAYVPEEITLFHRHFAETVDDWAIVGETPFLDDGAGGLIFPDLCFQHRDGAAVHLELFHRWHASALSDRLQALDQVPAMPLIIGVDRHLAKQPAIGAQLDASSWFGDRGFLFRDFPGVATVRKRLAAVLAGAD
jgi:predicted nuclease of restriction endonuclease-like RecB superfamily